MKKVILSLALLSAGLFSTYACSAKASSNATAASTETATATSPSEEAAASQDAAAGAIKHIDAAYLRQHIWDYKEEPTKFVFKGSRPAILDFYADWCGPCRRLGPKLEAVAKKYAGKIDVYKINIDKEPDLANIFGVKSIPMCLFIPMKGTPIQTVGELTPDQIEESISQIYTPAK